MVRGAGCCVAQGMRGIGPFVAERFLKIVLLRNKLARMAGYEDFYDYKVRMLQPCKARGAGGAERMRVTGRAVAPLPQTPQLSFPCCANKAQCQPAAAMPALSIHPVRLRCVKARCLLLMCACACAPPLHVHACVRACMLGHVCVCR